ncbi:MAG: WecB/TagA/CpsF family glycosyltransferase [Proteobacteria bacterium]|nr:WecB/TagA/CpsF family glycosyltransferase [Pseudomonadota bacterium]MBU1739428.1 WecB/TagA/CpsF family glycosyltransferase [Pseudomonadota bacterium]
MSRKKQTAPEPEHVLFKKVKISNTNFTDAFRTIRDNIATRGYACLTDVGVVISATHDEELKRAVGRSLMSIPDGMPLAWYARLLGCRRVERIAGGELLQRLLEDDNGLTHFLLGDTDETISRVIEKASRMNRKIRITGYSPPFKTEFTPEDTRDIFAKINAVSPDIIWVSFGGGKQDKWMHRNVGLLERGVMIGVGAAFRFYTGELKTPPRIIQNLGLQWFYRMMGNPVRWFKRPFLLRLQFLMHFPIEVIKGRLGSV